MCKLIHHCRALPYTLIRKKVTILVESGCKTTREAIYRKTTIVKRGCKVVIAHLAYRKTKIMERWWWWYVIYRKPILMERGMQSCDRPFIENQICGKGDAKLWQAICRKTILVERGCKVVISYLKRKNLWRGDGKLW